WMNDGNNNHYLACYLRGTTSNLDAVGAKLTLYTSAGIQVREVRSGESYGIMNSMNQIFGLGNLTAVDSLVIRWPSGAKDVLPGLGIDQYHTIQEGGCVVPSIVLTPNGATVICTGDSVAISAPEGYAYLWSNGADSQTIQATEAGVYTVTVTAAGGCTAISNEVSVTVDPVQIPSIAVTGDTLLCSGGTVVLTSTPATSYLWSNGATTQSIEVNAGGLYAVTTQGLCDVFTSVPQSVDVIVADAPQVTGDTIFEGETALLSAQGDSIVWYATETSNVPIASGNFFVTGALTTDTQFWVEQVVSVDQPNAFAGMTDHQGTTYSGNTFNGQIIFDAYTPFRLKSVKVYTDKAGVRKIDLRDANNGAIQSVAVDIPVGTSVIDLGLDVPVGNGLILTTDEVINQLNLGYASARLRRSDAGVTYPYKIDGVVSITGSNGGEDRYYSFFDWEIDFYGISCTSPRIPVAVQVDSIVGTGEPIAAGKLELWPSPTTGVYHLELTNVPHGSYDLMVINAQGEQVNRQTIQAQGQVLTSQLVKLPAGVYTVQLRGEAGLWVEKVVLVK
ncbi:MAG: ASPIC/UnbV domain-containing protein, partial [Saprospiraceae bacterium]|nr:ASPIC/UnbV domain-containing protein [Saprospiraceae bacterium]